jgi:hypothetical protein
MLNDTGLGGSDDGGGPPPKDPGPGAGHPTVQPLGPRSFTVSEQGRAQPIVYGTAKVPALLIEKVAPLVLQPATWQASHAYIKGDFVLGLPGSISALLGGPGTGVYECTTGGTSASSGGPTGTGSSISDNTVTWKYRQQAPFPLYAQNFLAALCEGPADGGWKLWWDKETFGNIGSVQATFSGKTGLQLYLGVDAANQVVPAQFDQAGYQHTVLIGTPLGLAYTGTQQELPDIAVTLQALLFGASTPDPSPADVVNDILTHSRRGCGWSGSRVDTSITGTGAGAYRVYCDAAGFRFSMVLDAERSALEILADILSATNSDAVWSGGKLKVVPLGDQAIASPVYGATGYVPTNTAQYNLGPDDFLDKLEPVRLEHRRSDNDCFNTWPLEYTNRAQSYARDTVEDPDQVDVDARGGIKRAQTISLPVIYPDGTYVVALSRILAQRSLNVRNIYTFRLNWRYMLLEPTDVVTLTEPMLGLNLTPVRIVSMEEGEEGLVFTAEDYPAGVAASGGYAPALGDGYQPNEKLTATAIPSTVDGVQLGIQGGQVERRHLSYGNFDNLWPNPTSEVVPPPGADTMATEWAGRLNAGAGAYSGDWVRDLAPPTGGRVQLGDSVVAGGLAGNPPSFQSQLALILPCSPGEKFYIEAQTRFITATTNEEAGVYMYWLDKDRKVLSTSTDSFNKYVAPASPRPTTWNKVSTSGTAPAGTCFVYLFLYTNTLAGTNTEAQFDAIYARRMVGTSLVEAGAITTTLIADDSISTPKLQANSITSAKINAGAVTAAKIDADAIATSNYAEDGSGIPTAGAKLQVGSTALKAAAGAIQMGYLAVVTYSGQTPTLDATRSKGISSISQQTIGGFRCLRINLSHAFPDTNFLAMFDGNLVLGYHLIYINKGTSQIDIGCHVNGTADHIDNSVSGAGTINAWFLSVWG